MGTLLITISVAFAVAFVTFIVCEEKSLKNADLSDLKLVCTEEVNISSVFEQYNTIRYLATYGFIVFLMAIIVAYFVFVPRGYGLAEVMAYVFFPSMFGSLAILLVKWRFQPFIKLASSFFYGSIYMAASALGMAVVYLLKG